MRGKRRAANGESMTLSGNVTDVFLTKKCHNLLFTVHALV